ncbi:hypothetical protein B0H63DRAFT_560650 [Podospora didyma]|uniref:Chitin-binding type-4 domain-containing protein n=1 Tax=Podospora didyma TaxID=330526 RepID=A0AAE0TV18_9PEZI|nr:hypothetical protein B0H63DRAFT_560650 [Podospora didyma]
MRSSLVTYLAVAGTATAHSWLECSDHDQDAVLPQMIAGSKKNPPELVDPVFFPDACKGWPRAKQNPGDWIEESSNLAWNLAANGFGGDNHACNPLQRKPAQSPNAPAAAAKAGGSIMLRYGGNGHTRGATAGEGGDPGQVQVFWAGKKETEIVTVDELTKDKIISQAGFAENSFSYPEDPAITKPAQGLVDKGNWQKVTLPSNMEAGRHMLVWVWSFNNKPQWSSCFDVIIS